MTYSQQDRELSVRLVGAVHGNLVRNGTSLNKQWNILEQQVLSLGRLTPTERALYTTELEKGKLP